MVAFGKPDKYSGKRIVHTQPGPCTAGGPGDILTDEDGNTYLVVPNGWDSGMTAPNVRKVVNGRVK